MSVSVMEARPSKRPGLWLRQAGKENAVIDSDSGSVHLLNETALAIWQLCDGETWPREMVRAICDVSGLPEEVVGEDIARTLHGFDHLGLLVWMVDS